jgi:AcrR family transcriptional regulator
MSSFADSAAALAPATIESPPARGRKVAISRDDILSAALKLIGPHRSISTLSLREVAREAGVAPNSFYRHFHDMDALAIALIEMAGSSLRKIIGEARHRANSEQSVVRSSVEVFVDQLDADDKLLHMLLREGTAGSEAFKAAVEKQLSFFEDELQIDLIRLAALNKTGLYDPKLTAKAITRLVFAIGTTAMDKPAEQRDEIKNQLAIMVRMIIVGSQTMDKTRYTPT